MDKEYFDGIVICPAGFSAILAEYVAKGYGHCLSYDEAGQVTGMAARFNVLYPEIDNWNTPTIAWLRGYQDEMEALAAVAWDNAQVLALAPAGGQWDEELQKMVTVFDLVAANPVKLAAYEAYLTHLPYLDEFGQGTAVDTGLRNPRAWQTLLVDDGLGGSVEVANSDYEPIRMPMGRA